MAELWALSAVEDDSFVASPPGGGFLFGGQAMALLLRAGAATVAPTLVPKSMHCTFVRGGRWSDPVDLEVERINEGRSFAHRVVKASQGGELLVHGTLSFHRPDESDDDYHQPGPPGPRPHELEIEPVAVSAQPGEVPELDGIIEVRPLGGPRPPRTLGRIHPYWSRPGGPVPDDPLLAACVLTFTSDYMVIGSSHREPVPGGQVTVLTLSHTLWFHRPSRAGTWHCYDNDVISEVGGRFVARGTVHDDDGRLVASYVQEVLKRPVRT